VIELNCCNFYFRVDGSAHIGGGHIYRCMTLALSLQQLGSKCHFICSPHTGNFVNKLQQYQLTVSLLSQTTLTLHEEITECRQIIENEIRNQSRHSSEHFNILVVDHYDLDESFESALYGLCHFCVVIDDLANRSHDCDLLLDQSIGRQTADYQHLVSQRCNQLLIGSHNALLRNQFKLVRKTAIHRRLTTSIITKILIALSATDPDNITLLVLNHLAQSNVAKNLCFIVILSSNAPHLEQVKAFINESNLTIELLIDVDDIAHHYLQADIAIASAGTAFLERCSVALPCLLIELAENQHHIAEYLKQNDLVLATIERQKLSFELTATLEQILNTIKHDLVYYQNHCRKIHQLCDGNGVTNLIKAIQHLPYQQTVTLRPVIKSDEQQLLKWQQIPITRKYSRNPQAPTPEQHHLWFTRIFEQKTSPFYIITENHQAVGFIRLEPSSKKFDGISSLCYEVSIAIAPVYFGRQLGVKALNLLANLHPDKNIVAYIHPDNIASQRCFIKAGFVLLTSDENWYIYPNFNHKRVINAI
jgi:UDP-2,4-diacetamido-2,4,6-trideoxy-beta-L-altropyranose hydrolase